jgi:Fe-S cluster biogenesis protein NfuA
VAPPSTNLRAAGDRIEQLLGQLRTAVDPSVWAQFEDVLSLVTELYGAGLARVVELILEPAVPADSLLGRIVADELLASLLVLHGLHPDSLSARVERALTSCRPYLASHGGDVELLELDSVSGSARLRLLGSCDGCPSSSATLRYAVEQAIAEAAPEIVRIEVEGLDDESDAPAIDPLSIPVTLSRKPAGARA